jgi:hypothetical protein
MVCPCDCENGGGGGGDPTYVDVTCLSACTEGTPFGCALEQLPTAWCIQPLGTPSGTSMCPWLFSNGTKIVGDPCVFCVWGMTAIALLSCHGSPTFVECNNFQITGVIACAGIGYSSDLVSHTNTDNGMYICISIHNPFTAMLSEALYFVAAGDFDCTGENVLTKVDEVANSDTFPSTITITPCSHSGVCFDPAC